MILNVSGRTDIVAFYSKWFLQRYKEGFVDVRNPFNPKLVSRISFKDVDAILFCTKNPIPILDSLKVIQKTILFHVTITPYKKEIEPNVLDKRKIIDATKKLSKIIGIQNLWVRYDPIFLSDIYTIEYHKKAFKRLCELLDGYVEKIIVSFLDEYKNVRKNQAILRFRPFTDDDYKEIGISFSKIAKEHHMTVQTCFEEQNLVSYGFILEDCLSHELAFAITKKKYKNWTSRKGGKCHCVETVDIGAYNSCPHFCKYCYANYDEEKVKSSLKMHDVNSSLLLGHIEKEDIIKERKK